MESCRETEQFSRLTLAASSLRRYLAGYKGCLPLYGQLSVGSGAAQWLPLSERAVHNNEQSRARLPSDNASVMLGSCSVAISANDSNRQFTCYCQDSLVSVVTTLQAGRPRNRGLIAGKVKRFISSRNVRTGLLFSGY